MLFSATMPADVAHLVKEMLHDPVRIDISPTTITADNIDQRVYFVAAQDKRALLRELLLDKAMKRVIVFTRTKHGANKVTEYLGKAGHVAEAIHGNKTQNARQRALEDFRAGRARILVATDIAARGIDIDDVTHVINYELPDVAESYVHRIGRTARAGSGGMAIAFCDPSERDSLRAIERLVKRELTAMAGQSRPPEERAAPKHERNYAAPRNRNRRFRGGRNARHAA
jgi:ATP-dependent RNA helicase RhlE